VSVFLVKSGFLAFFFLVPLGVAGFSFGWKPAWKGAAIAAALNALWAAGLSLLARHGFTAFFLDLGYYCFMAAVFTWFIAPPLKGPGILRIRASYRLILGALAGTVLGMWFAFGESAGLQGFIRSQAELLSSLYVSSAGGDAVQRSLLEQELSPERIAAVFNMVLARGGALASMMAVFFLSRQFALGLTALVWRRRFREHGVSIAVPVTRSRDFHVPPFLIWVFSGSLAGILLFRIAGLAFMETGVWNLLVVCALMYLAQGLGILQFVLSRRNLPVPLRFIMNVGIILVIFSPGINVMALGLLMLLGIVEHWAPLRVAAVSKRQP
jgi:hypothetical protein